MTSPAVVVTGVGVVSPAGLDAHTTFDHVLAAKGVTTAELTAPVVDFDPTCWIDPREVRRIDRVGQFGLAAAAEAIAQAGLTTNGSTVDPRRVAVVVGSGVGGLTTLEDGVETRVTKGSHRVGPLLVPMMMPNATAGLIALRHGFRGAALAVATACASGANSIGEGMHLIRSGRADVVVAGGSEAAITPTALAGFARMGALSSRTSDPAGASRPFDRDRDGFVMGEGAGIVVLESEDHATRRGATILGEVAGYGATCDAHHLTAPDPTGQGALESMRLAIADAGLDPRSIGHVNAHGTSTPLNDRAESDALVALFGGPTPPVTSTKGVTGHLVGAAGAVEAVIGLLSARSGRVPPVANLTDPDVDPDVDLVRDEPRSINGTVVLSNSFGFGGHNAALVLIARPST
ncbi:MAG: beta-ketoacyl-[acyl-carrier-protein] synthase family protein [Acidimicrobiales bacterium]|nr:beta-ketoacyl-[acyl-carrier-protein] synthase family protein [Acidimicrobiales bacterium]